MPPDKRRSLSFRLIRLGVICFCHATSLYLSVCLYVSVCLHVYNIPVQTERNPFVPLFCLSVCVSSYVRPIIRFTVSVCLLVCLKSIIMALQAPTSFPPSIHYCL